MLTAKFNNLVACELCHKLNNIELATGKMQCVRCNSTIHSRKANSLERTWALVIASAIAFIPANMLPIMTVLYLGDGTPDTIISGIVLLIKMGMAPVALLVFVASFLVPLGKIVGIVILLLSVQKHTRISPNQRAILYRLVELFGKWSMLDVFVVSIMAAVVQLGFISEIIAGPGVTAFAIMVILTMFAAHAFDPRLIWDEEGNDDRK